MSEVVWYKLKFKEIISGVISIAAHFLLKIFTIEACSRLGGHIARTISYRYPVINSKLKRNIQFLKPEISENECDRLIKKWWDNHGRVLAEFSIFSRIQKNNKRIMLHGMENISIAKKTGRPIIFAFLHTSNWEHVGVELLKLMDNKGVLIYQDVGYFKMLIAEYVRKSFKNHLIKADHFAAIKVYRKLMSGDILCIAVDEIYGENQRFPTFGSALPKKGNISFVFRLAKMTNAIIVPLYMTRDQGVKFKLHIEPVVDCDFKTMNEDQITQIFHALNLQFSEILKNNLDQWYYLPN